MKELTYKVLQDVENNQINWGLLSYQYRLDEDFIRKYQDKVYWFWIWQFQNLSESFIREFKDRICWGSLSEFQILSDNFIIEFQDNIFFHILLKNRCLKQLNHSTQRLILEKSIGYIKAHKKFCYNYMTGYMEEQFEKLSIML